jgi:hypothetical protein
MSSNRSAKIVKPAWTIDSIRQGRLLAWTYYRLYNEKEYMGERAFWQQTCLTSHDSGRINLNNQLDSPSTNKIINDSCDLTSDDMSTEISDPDLIEYLNTTPLNNHQVTT